MTIFSTRKILNLSLAGLCALNAGLFDASAKQDGQKVNAKLVCGAHTANPENLRDFQANLVFTLSGDTLAASRKLERNGRKGEEIFKGTVGPTGSILVTGQGGYKNAGQWVYEFTGSRSDNSDTTLEGKRTNTSGAVGSRDCTLTFFKPRAL